MRKFIALSLSFIMIASMTACGSRSSNVSSSGSTKTNINESSEETSSVSGDNLETTESQTAMSAESDMSIVPITPTDDQEMMYGVIAEVTLLAFRQRLGVSYNLNDEDSKWLYITGLLHEWQPFLNDGTGRMVVDDAGRLVVTEDLVKEYTSALFADFDGNLNTPDNQELDKMTMPEGSLEYYVAGDYDLSEATGIDNSDNIFVSTYKGMGIGCSDDYVDYFWDNHNVVITSWVDNPDGTCTVTGERIDYDFNLPYYEVTFELVKNLGADSSQELYFPYRIASVKVDFPLNRWGFVLPGARMIKYTKEELSGLTREELELAKNEIYARCGLIFDDPELNEYFSSQPWYQGRFTLDQINVDNYYQSNMEIIDELLSNM